MPTSIALTLLTQILIAWATVSLVVAVLFGAMAARLQERRRYQERRAGPGDRRRGLRDRRIGMLDTRTERVERRRHDDRRRGPGDRRAMPRRRARQLG